VSARATHLKAVTENVFVTTIERKQMSNKTSFKRIALGVVAALGFGVLASSPSSAAITNLVVTVEDGKATTLNSDSSTAATIDVSFLALAGGNADSFTVTVAQKSALPTGAVIGGAGLMWFDSSSAVAGNTPADIESASALTTGAGTNFARYVRKAFSEAEVLRVVPASAVNNQMSVKFKFDLGETTTSTIKAGTYAFTAIVTTPGSVVTTKDFNIVVSLSTAEAAAASTVIDPSKSTAIMSLGASFQATTLDSPVSLVSTPAAANQAVIRVVTQNASGAAANESITATISGAGVLCSEAGACGASLTLPGDGSYDIGLRADGRAGVATIAISTPTKTFTSKSAVFFAVDPATYVPSLDIPVIGVGATSDVVSIAATDTNKNVWGGTNLYLYSSDTTIASNATCTFNATDKVHYCPVTGVKAGETKWTIGNKSTLATSTIKSAEFAGPRVTAEAAASVKIEFDKTAYAPGEKARIYVTPLDAAGKAIAGGTISGLLATGGISSSVAFASGSDTTTATALTVASASSATTGDKAGSAMYTVYMPFGKGTVTLTAKGGTGLPAAGQVALTASASVVDDSVDAAVDAAQEATDAAIAATDAAILAQEAADEAASAAIAAQETAQAAVDAVTALSAEVTKLVAQLATLQKLLNRVAKRVGVKL
jgi:hypothetical protein